MNTINITISANPDIASLVKLHAASFQQGWKESDFNDMFAVAGTMALVTEEGFAVVRQLGTEAEVLTFAVNPEVRRKGIGNALTEAMKDWLRQNNADSVFLEVRESNEPALNMYAKAGFVRISERKAYYSNQDGSRESAIVMRSSL